MYAEFLTPKPFNPTTFPNDVGYDELVLWKNIPFTSLCAHHGLPFSRVAHVAYLPGKRILGLSKLARIVNYFSRSLQVQERLTKQIADWIENELEPRGVGVVLEAEHLCMTIRASFKEAKSTPFVIKSRTCSKERRARAEDVAEVLLAGNDSVDLGEVLVQLRQRGIELVLCEGGPTLSGSLAEAGLSTSFA